MKKYFLIIVTMAVAFAFSSYAGRNIFMANTPQVNPNYLANLQSQFKKSIDNVYLAFSSLKKIGNKKDIASVNQNTNGNVSFVTGIPDVTKPVQKPIIAKIEPTSIPSNLFKSISKGVSAYEPDSNHIVFKFDSGAKLKTKKFQFPDGKVVDMLDFSGQ
ncbi:exported hypothetical protein [Candidatus Roizmanbacteria bacterium]|nr:exported hypothetical protein [Candidatus Roizmanbacteria bacterium]